MTLRIRRLAVVLTSSTLLACSSRAGAPADSAPGTQAPVPTSEEAPAATRATAPAASAAPTRAPVSAEGEAAGPPFTAEQVERGLEVFRDTCVECHYRSDFRGTQFQFEWRRRSVRDFYKTIVETMPEENPGELDPQEYIDVVTFVLSLNGFPPGDTELVADEEALQAFSMAAPNRGPG